MGIWLTDGTDVSACWAVPKVGDLAQVLRQVILVVSLVGQLQVTTKRVQPHWISPVAVNPAYGIQNHKLDDIACGIYLWDQVEQDSDVWFSILLKHQTNSICHSMHVGGCSMCLKGCLS